MTMKTDDTISAAEAAKSVPRFYSGVWRVTPSDCDCGNKLPWNHKVGCSAVQYRPNGIDRPNVIGKSWMPIAMSVWGGLTMMLVLVTIAMAIRINSPTNMVKLEAERAILCEERPEGGYRYEAR